MSQIWSISRMIERMRWLMPTISERKTVDNFGWE